MEMKKKYAIILFGAVIFAGALFGALQFSKTKKTFKVDVASLSESDDADTEQKAAVENQVGERLSADQKEEIIVKEPKKNNIETDSSKADVPEEVAEKKIVEPEKQVQTETKGEVGKIVDRFVSWGFAKSSGRKIDTVIIHSSYDALGKDPYSVSGIIEIYKQYEVSAHYLIDRGGVIYRLVADQNVAWHAGVAKMPDGRTDVNSFSIGIEMINTLDGKYTDEQYRAVNSLIASLEKKYAIKNILGHNEIAPGRKTDPWGIEWKKINR